MMGMSSARNGQAARGESDGNRNGNKLGRGMALLAAACLAAGAAQAQPATAPGYPAQAPGQIGPEEARQGGFIVTDTMDQHLGMDLIGGAVYGGDGEHVGDVSDLIFHEDGRIVGLIVGVGGVLGIGEKDVGIPIEVATIERPPAPPSAAALAAAGRAPHDLEVRIPMTRAALDAAPAFVRSDPGWAPRPAPGVPVTGVPEPETPVAPQ